MVATQTFRAPAYSYDALGRRIESISDVRDLTKRYYHDGQQVIEEYDGAGTPARQRYYVWGNYIDELLMFNDDAGDDSDYNVCHDQLYSAHALLSKADGAIVERYDYDAYGKPVIYTDDGGDGDWWDGDESTDYVSAKGLVYLFTGREYESLSSYTVYLQYSRGRYYHLALHRWMQRDLEEYFEGMSLYEYALSSPIINVDWLGASTTRPSTQPSPKPNTCQKARQIAQKMKSSTCPKPVACVFRMSKSILCCSDGSKVKASFAFSGGGRKHKPKYKNKPKQQNVKDLGPLPIGKWRIDKCRKKYKTNWHTLWYWNGKKYIKKNIGPNKRFDFTLHPGTFSEGCLTVPNVNPNCPTKSPHGGKSNKRYIAQDKMINNADCKATGGKGTATLIVQP